MTAPTEAQLAAARAGHCPSCGSERIDANTWESWCYRCDRQWTKIDHPDFYNALREVRLARDGSLRLAAKQLDDVRTTLCVTDKWLAQALDRRRDTVERWRNGREPIPYWVTGKLVEIIKQHQQTCQALIDELEALVW